MEMELMAEHATSGRQKGKKENVNSSIWEGKLKLIRRNNSFIALLLITRYKVRENNNL